MTPGVPVAASVRRSLRTALAGLAAGATHINSWHKSANLQTAADRYVVTPNNVSIDGYGLVDVSIEPVVIRVPVSPSAR